VFDKCHYTFSGFGFAFAKHFDELGFVVFAGCLNEKGEGAEKLRNECSKRLHVVELDVTKDKSVLAAFKYIKQCTPKHGTVTSAVGLSLKFVLIRNVTMLLHVPITLNKVIYQ
jgi:NAD(P)-dependent dehydrogenase (short-subunit alcohol dehydrogenase family)